ncbi:MAG: tetratricopeptide repeat protein [Bacteroidales bacterium]|nr:tetratricopeptide repeat protein [Candidatus Liminaster caballi]
MFGQTDTLALTEMRALHREFKNGAQVYYGERYAGQSKELSNMLSAAGSYIDYFANQDLSSVPSWELPIIDMVKTGQYANAIARYERRNLLGEFESGADLYPSIERYVMLLELSGIRQNAIKGLTTITKVADTDTTTLRSMNTLITLAIDLRQYSVADNYFNVYYRRSSGKPADVAQVFALRAEACMRRSKPNEALRMAAHAVSLYDSLATASKDPGFEALNRARAFRVQGEIANRLDEYESSLANLYKSFDLYEMSAGQNGIANLTERVRAYYSMGMLATDLKDYEFADKCYRKVEALGSWMFEGNRYQQLQFTFSSMRLRGLALVQQGQYDEAYQVYMLAEEALNEMERIAPNTNIIAFQNINFNIASLYYSSGNLEKALEYDRKILDMVLNDHQTEEHRHNLDLAYCYKYVGNCLWAIGYNKYLQGNKKKTKEVMDQYKEAQQNYQMARRYNPKDMEARAKAELASLILQGLEKPQPMPRNVANRND